MRSITHDDGTQHCIVLVLVQCPMPIVRLFVSGLYVRTLRPRLAYRSAIMPNASHALMLTTTLQADALNSHIHTIRLVNVTRSHPDRDPMSPNKPRNMPDVNVWAFSVHPAALPFQLSTHTSAHRHRSRHKRRHRPQSWISSRLTFLNIDCLRSSWHARRSVMQS